MAHLESTHHFCLKRIQNLPMQTRSDMVIGLLGFTTLTAYIDLQKLYFLGSLCRLKSTDLASKVFSRRLFQFRNRCTIINFGFIPDLLTILKKYHLQDYIEQYIQTCSFPSKYIWKRVCKRERGREHERHQLTCTNHPRTSHVPSQKCDFEKGSYSCLRITLRMRQAAADDMFQSYTISLKNINIIQYREFH